ncbi:FIST C-terminal domain-containing protein [bacterium]|nr:FIST C-terminal domain-containing protein [bacterium]
MRGDKAGIGYSELKDSLAAGQEAARGALADRDGQPGSLALAFCTGRHDPQACLEGIRSELGDTPVLGGAAIGIITAGRLGYEGYQVGIAVLPADLAVSLAAAGGMERDEKEAGRKLAEALNGSAPGASRLGLLFYETVRQGPPPAPRMNVSSWLLEGFGSAIRQAPALLLGAGLISSYSMTPGFQFLGAELGYQSAGAVLLDGEFEAFSGIMHGCKPMSDYHTITRVEGPVVFEIDNRPALDVVQEMLGEREWKENLPLMLITLGRNMGGRYDPFNETRYINRLVVGGDSTARSITLFEADFENGSEFRFMRRNEELMLASTEKGCRDARARLVQENLEPFFALYIDCAGRAAGYCGADQEEADIVRRAIGRDIPLLGFYSGVEIAPLLGRSRGLDWTGVLLIMSRKK